MISTTILSLEEVPIGFILVMHIATRLGTRYTAVPTVEHLLQFMDSIIIVQHCGQDNTETPRSSLYDPSPKDLRTVDQLRKRDPHVPVWITRISWP